MSITARCEKIWEVVIQEQTGSLLDHLVSLEGFLDKSIVYGFSYGVEKAELCRTGGKLLGHLIGRSGSSPDPERAQAVRDFPPLREKLHVQQFLGSANWLRTYLPAEFGHCSKLLSAYQKPGASFPPEGLGAGSSEGCKAVRAIKKMLESAIGLFQYLMRQVLSRDDALWNRWRTQVAMRLAVRSCR